MCFLCVKNNEVVFYERVAALCFQLPFDCRAFLERGFACELQASEKRELAEDGSFRLRAACT